MSKMTAAVFEQIGEPLVVREVDRPTLGPDQLLLKVGYVGICGSDLHRAETPGMLPAGTILGHEFSGEIVESTSSDWRVGERITVNPFRRCAVCEGGGKCHDGPEPDCLNGWYMGFSPQMPGAYAQYVKVHAYQALRLPDNISLRDGALTEPLAVARHSVVVSGGVEGNTVLVIGGGPIGLGVVLMAIEAGASKVIVSEPDPVRRACALELGADAVFDPLSVDVSKAMSEAGFSAPDVVFECVGAPGFVQLSIDLLAPRGRVVIVGVCMAEDRFKPLKAIRKAATLVFALGYTTEDFKYSIQYLAKSAEKASRMISQTVSLTELPGVFDTLRKEKSLIKVVIEPNAD